MFARVAIVLALTLGPGLAQAECFAAAAGGSCGTALGGVAVSGAEMTVKTVRAERTTPLYGVGDTLPAGQYYMLINREYYGLPPIDGYWRYYRVEGRVLKVHPDTLTVIGDATSLTNAAF